MPGISLEHVALSERGAASKRYISALEKTLRSPDPDMRAELSAIAEDYRRLALSPGSVSTVQVLQNMAIGYQNDEYIGTRLMPVVNTVTDLGQNDGQLSVEYWAKDKDNTFDDSDDDDAIGTDGTVGRADENFSLSSVSLTRRARKRFIDAWTDAAMDSVLRRMISPTITLADKLALKQERRIAAVLGTYTNYASSNYAALSGSDQWNSSTGGDPKAVVDTALAALFYGGPGQTVGFCSLSVYNTLKKHPTILEAFKYGGLAQGYVTRQQLAQYFELDDLLVGKTRYKSSKEGQSTKTYGRVWSDVFGVVRVAQPVSVDQAAFGLTIESPHFQLQWFENGTGGRGGFNNQIAYADALKITASDAGYLITSPLA